MSSKIVKICVKHGELTVEQVREEKTKHGYITYRCYLCKIEKDRRWKLNNREQHIEASVRWKKNNKEKVNEWAKQDRILYPDKYKERSKRSRHNQGGTRSVKDVCRERGITFDIYQKMVEEQNNLCAICNQPEKRNLTTKNGLKRLCIDHCHKTNTVRALLCASCNAGLGHFKESIQALQSAIKYLKKYET